jgi:7-carboxy-7-deazaguanine synthase
VTAFEVPLPSVNAEIATDQLARDWLLVSETFHSIQGEGPSAGQNAFFVRLGACNQHCKWCDSGYTWVFTERQVEQHDQSLAPFDPQEELTRVPIRTLAYEIIASDAPLCVVSGGEPLLQLTALAKLISMVNENLFPPRFEIETAGTIRPGELTLFDNVTFNVSPKLEHSGNPLELRRNIEALRELGTQHFKFVVRPGDNTSTDLDEIREIIREVGIHRSRVWLMPLGTTADSVTTGMRWLAPVVLENGWNLSSRFQTLIWGDERGR